VNTSIDVKSALKRALMPIHLPTPKGSSCTHASTCCSARPATLEKCTRDTARYRNTDCQRQHWQDTQAESQDSHVEQKKKVSQEPCGAEEEGVTRAMWSRRRRCHKSTRINKCQMCPVSTVILLQCFHSLSFVCTYLNNTNTSLLRGCSFEYPRPDERTLRSCTGYPGWRSHRVRIRRGIRSGGEPRRL
jgi:hypothetical protein